MEQLDDLIGKVLGDQSPYLIDSLIGDGKLGRVYKAIDINTYDESSLLYRAIEFLPINLKDYDEVKAKFHQLMQDYLPIQDRDIIQILDYGSFTLGIKNGQAQEFLFVVMEFIEASINNLPLPFAPELYISSSLETIILRCLGEETENQDYAAQELLKQEKIQLVSERKGAHTDPLNPTNSSNSATNQSLPKRSQYKLQNNYSVRNNLVIVGSLLTAVALCAGGLYLFTKSQAIEYSNIPVLLEPTQNQVIAVPPSLSSHSEQTDQPQSKQTATKIIASSNSNNNSAVSSNNSAVPSVNPPFPDPSSKSPPQQAIDHLNNTPISINSNFRTIPIISKPLLEPLPEVEVVEGDGNADTKELKLTLEAYSSRSFSLLITKAESSADRAIAREFANYPQLNYLAIMVFGDRRGQLAPILSATISRSQWQSDPRIQSWANYMLKSEVLLGFAPPQLPKANLPRPNATTPVTKPVIAPPISTSSKIPSLTDTQNSSNSNTSSTNFKNNPDSGFSDD